MPRSPKRHMRYRHIGFELSERFRPPSIGSHHMLVAKLVSGVRVLHRKQIPEFPKLIGKGIGRKGSKRIGNSTHLFHRANEYRPAGGVEFHAESLSPNLPGSRAKIQELKPRKLLATKSSTAQVLDYSPGFPNDPIVESRDWSIEASKEKENFSQDE